MSDVSFAIMKQSIHQTGFQGSRLSILLANQNSLNDSGLPRAEYDKCTQTAFGAGVRVGSSLHATMAHERGGRGSAHSVSTLCNFSRLFMNYDHGSLTVARYDVNKVKAGSHSRQKA
jgi:hypothetical protein